MKKNLLMTLMLAVVLVVGGKVSGQEVLLNGTFESWDDANNPTSWTHVESITQEATANLVYEGTYSAKHVGGTKDLGQTISGIIAGDEYTLTLWYKVTAGDGTDARIWSYWKNGSTNLNDHAAELRGPNNLYLDNNGGVWSSYTVTLTAPATADNFYFEVRTYSSATVYWDAFSFLHVSSTTPTITLNPTTLSGFSYTVGNGPSTEQTFTVEGSNLTNNLSLAASTNYEISKSSGSGYTTSLTYTPAEVNTPQTVYVRLKAGLSIGDYNAENITATSVDADPKTVTCSGSVTAPPPPTITLSHTTLSGFTYLVGNGPSTEQTFTVEGSNLTNDISIAASTNYEISETSGSGYSSPITLAKDGSGTVSTTTIYVRLKSGLTAGSYDNEDITVTSGTTEETVTCNGNITDGLEGGMEDFSNFSETGTAYVDGTFTGQDGSTWTYNDCRGDQEITNETPCLKNATSSNVYSGTINNGVGTLSFDYMQAFSTNVNLDVLVNGMVVGTVTSSGEQGTIKNSGNITVNVSGDFVIKFQQNTSPTGGQVAIDNITWTGYAGGGNLPPVISNITHTPSIPQPTETVLVSAEVTDSDGTVSGVELYWGTTSGSLANNITMTNTSGNTYQATIPTQSNGTTVYYEIYALDDDADETTSAEQSYTVTESVPLNAWINEFHYDNVATDVDEFIEVVIENAGSFDLSDFQITLYSGHNGGLYNQKTLNDFTEGNTTDGFTFYYYYFPVNGIENGDPDGMALSYQGTVITDQFLSYEGSFTAVDGPAYGLTSTDIGVTESSSTAVGESLQLGGVGSTYGEFTWQTPLAETHGALNFNQYFTPPLLIANIVHTPVLPNSSQTVSVSADVTDDVNIFGVELHWGTTSGSLTNTINMSLTSGSTYTTDTDIPVQANGTTVYYEVYAMNDDLEDATSDELSYTVSDLATQPLAHVLNFMAGTTTTGTIPLSWTDSDADYYLIKGVATGGTITDPVDGTFEADGALALNIAAGTQACTFTGLDFSTTYVFKIYPYNGTGNTVNYLTDPTVPSTTATTLMPSATLPYAENFADCGTQLWTSVSVASDQDWACGSGYMAVNGYAGDVASDDYLISPIFNMDNYADEILHFDSYNQDIDATYPPIELLYTDSYTGDPTTTTWNNLTATWCPENGMAWTSSGNIDVSGITGTTIQFAFHYTSSGTESGTAALWQIDNIDLHEVQVEDPQSFTASAVSASQIDLSFVQNLASDDVVIVYNATGTFSAPSGTPPAVGQPFAGGTVLYSGSTSPQAHTGLSPQETVYYMAYSYDGNFYSVGLSATATTLSLQPSNHASGFAASTYSSTSILVTWTDSDAEAYLIKASVVSYGDIVVPIDGIFEPDATLTKNVSQGVGSCLFTGLTPSTTYYFKIYAYNGTGTTVNYKTDETVPEDEAATGAAVSAPNVFISEYVEGSSFNKAIEIYNGDASDIDLSDITVKLFSNGAAASSPTTTWTGSGMLKSGHTYILYNSSGVSTVVEKGQVVSGVATYNGNDAIGLYYQDELVDVVGIIGNDPGTGWDVAGVINATADHSLVRKPTITAGNPDWATSIGTDAASSEWVVFAQDHFFNLGVFGTGWTGATNDDWHTAGNWDVQVPDGTVNALINACAADFPIVISPATCKNLRLEILPTCGEADMWLNNTTLTLTGTSGN